MRAIALGLGLLLAATPAIACVCIQPSSEAEMREVAARIAMEAAAVAEVVQIAPMDQSGMRGETYRVLKVHVGQAPAQFELDRGFERGSGGDVQIVMTSCDVVPAPAERTTVVLYSTTSPSRYRIGGTCDHLFVNSEGALDLVREEAAKMAAERG